MQRAECFGVEQGFQPCIDLLLPNRLQPPRSGCRLAKSHGAHTRPLQKQQGVGRLSVAHRFSAV